MTKKSDAAKATAAVTPEPVKSPTVSLTEFCKTLSLTEARYPLISAFFYVENLAGRISDTEAAFAKRYDEYIKSPAQ
ncbi:hypothetical protein EU642_22045 [Salmonella enterica]|nr:hypothetical protein [Salmonella enterica]EAO0118536.1 hypothetical protein [Salmonella enterica]EAO3601640.1 hypothetical protein [Salmonella enterica]EAR6391534.1 hypothetical protein [Salmonella enterica]EAV1285298.1 hypothetical protein [Salmonella enterica]